MTVYNSLRIDGSIRNTILTILGMLLCLSLSSPPRMAGLTSCTMVWMLLVLTNRLQYLNYLISCSISFFQPQQNYNEWRLLYFISFLLLVGFFVLNMFVGVVVENFHRCRAAQEKEERAARAIKRAKKIEERRKRKQQYFF